MKIYLMIHCLLVTGFMCSSELSFKSLTDSVVIIWHTGDRIISELEVPAGRFHGWASIDIQSFCDPVLDEEGNRVPTWTSPNAIMNTRYLEKSTKQP